MGTKFLDTCGKKCINSECRGVAQPGSALEWGGANYKITLFSSKYYTQWQVNPEQMLWVFCLLRGKLREMEIVATYNKGRAIADSALYF